ncbi:MAG: hypothetical protein NTW26_06965 [bacterium]|nr:hypothetical protein [bacterium]
MPDLLDIPGDLAGPRDGRGTCVRMRGTGRLIETLDRWKAIVIAQYGGDPAGCLVANSCYRPKSDLDPGGPGAEPGVSKGSYPVDYTDANGHWVGCAVDYSARLTAESFWGSPCPKWRRDDIRDSLVAAGLYHPWYFYRSWVEGYFKLHEYWHIAVELDPWTQVHAYRETPPHWYDGLRPDSTAICTH